MATLDVSINISRNGGERMGFATGEENYKVEVSIQTDDRSVTLEKELERDVRDDLCNFIESLDFDITNLTIRDAD